MTLNLRTATLFFVLVVLTASTSHATNRRRGIVGSLAPSWADSKWYNVPSGVRKIDVPEYHGKVVYLFFFQSWCPGCHRHGFPTMRKVRDELDGARDVAFVAIQTVFEGHGANTAERGLDDLESFGLDIPFGHAPGSDGEGSPSIMRAYRSGGTPWTVIIDKSGVVRFDGFRIEPERALAFVKRLRAER